MNRKRPDITNVRISDDEFSKLENKLEVLGNEFSACKRKLESKCEALLILSKQLDTCRSERDQFKLMGEQLRERYQSMKKQLGQGYSASDAKSYSHYADMQSQRLAHLLCASKDHSQSIQFEVDDLKQKLHDAHGDIKLLREQLARQRVGTTDEGLNTRHFPAHEREELVEKLEAANQEYLQLERDLQTVLDEKQELVTERDVYKTKYERLNSELNYILKGDENRIVDIDALVMENKYLQDRMKQMEEEKSMAMAAVSKYKGLLEKKKNKSCMKLGQGRRGMVITQKQVHQVLESQGALIATPQAMADLQALAGALLDTVNDKNLALSHQRKTNKILGSRVSELEKKIKTLECAGLWNIPSNVSASLEKLRADCENAKTLIPRQASLTTSDGDPDSELEVVTPLDSALASPEPSPTHIPVQKTGALDHLQLEDLDLLPTKEVTTSIVQEQRGYLSNPRSLTDSFAKKLEVLSDLVSASKDIEATPAASNPPDTYVHVYSDDKISDSELTDTVDDDEEEEVDFIEKGGGDAESFYGNDTKSKLVEVEDEYHDAVVNSEASKQIGLLMESVAHKICKLSHSDSVDSAKGVDHPDSCNVAQEGDLVKSSPSGSPSCMSPLLRSRHESQGDHTEEVHNVEC